MELRVDVSTEREMDAVEAAVLYFLVNIVGVEPEEIFDSQVVEKASGGYTLIVSFIPSESLFMKFDSFRKLPNPYEQREGEKGYGSGKYHA